MHAKRIFVAMTAVRFGEWRIGGWLDKQVDTECTELPRSFTEKITIRLAQAARIVRRLRQAPRRNTPLSWVPAFAGTTTRSLLSETPWQLSAFRVHSIIPDRWQAARRRLNAARCQERAG